MRTRITVAVMASLLCLWGVAASAAVTFHFFFMATTGTGTVGGTAIDAVAGDTLTLGITISHDVAIGLSFAGVSVEWDTDGDNELDLGGGINAREWQGTGVANYGPLSTSIPNTTESTVGIAGTRGSFNQGSSGGFLPSGTFAHGTIVFTVNASVNSDGPDIFFVSITGNVMRNLFLNCGKSVSHFFCHFSSGVKSY